MQKSIFTTQRIMFQSFQTTNSPSLEQINNSTSPRHILSNLRINIPLKLLFHFLLLLTASIQLFVDNGETAYLRSARRNWLHFFFPADYQISAAEQPTNPYYLYTSDGVEKTLRKALKSYETIVELSLDSLAYAPPPESDSKPKEIKLTIIKYASPYVFDPSKDFDNSKEIEEFFVNSTHLGSLENESTRLSILRRVVEMTLSFQLVTIELVSLRRSCLVWEIQLHFQFASRGQILLSLKDEVTRDCDDTTSSSDIFSLKELLWLNLLLLLFSLGYLFALLKQIKILYQHQGVRTTINFLFSFWFISEFCSILCISLSSFVNLAENSARRPTGQFHSLVVGLGNCLLWVNVVQYFSHNKTYFALIVTLEKSVPKVFKFLLGIAPIFMGYGVFGISVFGNRTIRFSGIRNAFVTLFSLLNGDAINETFRDLLPLNSVIAEIYLYSFILLWTYVVLNILIAIVEESFFVALWLDKGEEPQPPLPPNWFRASRVATYRQVSSSREDEVTSVEHGNNSTNNNSAGENETETTAPLLNN